MMRQFFAYIFATGLLQCVSSRMEFTNPPPAGLQGDFKGNSEHVEGSSIYIMWTEPEESKKFSLVLYQVNETDGIFFGDWEFLTRDAVGVTNYSWLVGTRKELSESNIFHLSLYQEGRTTPDSNSHYFNIKEKSPERPTESPLILTSSITSGTTSEVSSVPYPVTTTPTLTTGKPTVTSSLNNQLAQPPNSSYKFPLEAKIGIGVAIPIALALGLATECLLLRKLRKKRKSPKVISESPQYREPDHQHSSSGLYISNLNEAPPRSPVELECSGPKHAI